MKPIVSFVAVSRNDNHGGDMTNRMNMFVNALSRQCDSFGLKAELILVEWNPPEDRVSLAEELIWPAGKMLHTRIITVPRELHNKYKYANSLPLYQMIGKNVGIRRARAKYILATNVDILFSDELIQWLAASKMVRGYNYHVDRYDVDMPLPDPENINPTELVEKSKNNLIRRNTRHGSQNIKTGKWANVFATQKYNKRERLHTNACGDFALAHRDHWLETMAYPELDLFSFHLDSLWSYIAHFSGVREELLEAPLAIYHIEHGGGYTPETLKTMDKTLEKKKLPRYDNFHFNSQAFRMSIKRRPIRYNKSDWGMVGQHLPESVMMRASWSISERSNADVNKYKKTKIALVVTARNDDHGGNLLERMQTFVDGWRDLATEEGLVSEIIFVEWNPPSDKPLLREALKWEKSDIVDLKFITVSEKIHQQLPNSDKIPLFQMIAKNVGARRTNAEWLLMTNVDVLFNRPMIHFLANAELDETAFYRASRLDCGERIIPSELTYDQKIQFCEENVIRVNINNQTMELENGMKLGPINENWKSGDNWFKEVSDLGLNHDLFSSACGDFTLMHRDAYDRLRGYPELPIWSIYIDGLILHAAIGNGMHQIELRDPLRMFHIEHGRSWVNDKSKNLKKMSLDHKNDYRPWCESLLTGKAKHVNPKDWGFSNLKLEVYNMNSHKIDSLEAHKILEEA
jgi:hypothetical protein